MDIENSESARAGGAARRPAIRFLVESALREVMSVRAGSQPRDRKGWVDHLVQALTSEAGYSHHAVIASLVATGETTDEIFERYIPAAARRLGELWVQDKASFVDVTVGAGRLQALYRTREQGTWDPAGGVVPLGQSFLMVIPPFEDHSLGAFAAADVLRKHGVWVHMAIGMTNPELVELLRTRSFAAIGLSVATWNTVEKVADVVDYLRANVDCLPPIVIGGRIVTDSAKVKERTGADYAVTTAREVVERCGLATIGTTLDFELSR